MLADRALDGPVGADSATATNPEGKRDDLRTLEEERALIERLRAGDRAAFGELYGWYGELLWQRAILPRLPNRELAEDCLRDTFRTAMEKLNSFTLKDRSIYFWLHRIAVNKAMDIHRRHRRDRKLHDAVVAEGPHTVSSRPAAPDRRLEIEDTRRQVEDALSRINARYARALRLRLLEERPREECAAILGVKVGTFDVILHRAAKAFRKEYAP